MRANDCIKFRVKHVLAGTSSQTKYLVENKKKSRSVCFLEKRSVVCSKLKSIELWLYKNIDAATSTTRAMPKANA